MHPTADDPLTVATAPPSPGQRRRYPHPPGGVPVLPQWGSERLHFVLGGLAVLVLALGMRIIAVGNTDVIQRDGVTFIAFAKRVLADPSGAVAAFDQHAGYPVLLALSHRVLTAVGWLRADTVEGWERAGQIVSVLTGTLATLAAWVLAGRTVGWRSAWVGAVLFAVGRKWLSLGADVMSDATMLCFAGWGLVTALTCLKKGGSAAYAALTGALAGAAYLVRPEGMGVAVVTVLLLAGAAALRRLGRAAALRAGVLCVATAVLVALPYMVAIGGLTKKKPIERLIAPGSESVSIGVPRHGLMLAQATVVGEAAKPRPGVGPAAERSGLQALLVQTVEALHPVVFGFVAAWGVGAVVLPRIRARTPATAGGNEGVGGPASWADTFLPRPAGYGAALIATTAALYAVVVLRLHATAGYVDWRHCMTIAFVLVPLAGAGLSMLIDLLAYLASPVRIKVLSVPRFVLLQWAWVFPVALAGTAWLSFGPLHGGKQYVRDAATGLRQLMSPSDRAATNLGWILHYAQVPGDRVDTGLVAGRAALARLESLVPPPAYVALSERWINPARPTLLELLPRERYELLASYAQKAARGDEADTIRIYRVRR